MEDVASKIGKGTGFIFLGTLGGYVVAFFYRIVLARWLMPYSYGIFSLVLILIGFFTAFFALGIPGGTTKYISEYLAKKKDPKIIFSMAFKITTLLAILSSVVLFFLSQPIAIYVFNNPDAVFPLQLGSFALFFILIGNLFNSALQGFQKMQFSAMGTISERLAKLFFSIIFLYIGFGLMGTIGAVICGSAIMAGVLIFSYRKTSSLSLKPMNLENGKLLMGFSIPFFITSISSAFLGWTDTLLIGYFLPMEQVGYYNVALPTLWILGVSIASLATALFPAFSEIKVKGNKKILEKVFNRSIKYALYFLIPAVSGVFILAEPIIRILFTTEYLPAVAAFQVLVFGSIFLSLKGITGSYINGIGKPKVVMKFALVAAVINVILNWVLIQIYGITGAALATSFSLLILFFLSLNFIRRGIKMDFRYFPKPLISATIMCGFILFVRSLFITSLLKMFLIIIFGAFIYFIVLYLLKGFDETDKRLIKRIYIQIRGSLK